MKIVLLRHGRPMLPSPRYVAPAELSAWIAAYDAAELDATLPPPAETVALARTCGIVVCSTLRRSQASATALGKAADVVDAAFQELPLTYAAWSGPRLPVRLWLLLFGLFAPRQAHEAPARQAATRLMEFARAGGPVLLVGHGLLNRAIARELRAAGWQGPAWPSTRHWACSIYEA